MTSAQEEFEAGSTAAAVVRRAAAHAEAYLAAMPDRSVAPPATYAQTLAALDVPLPTGPTDPLDVLDALVVAAEPGVAATGSGRFFGYVIGGVLPAALGAELMTGVWDQNAAFTSLAPAASAAEEVAARWNLDLLGLPPGASVGFTTGTTMANLTALAAARHRVLAAAGWDVAADGLTGAPPVRIVVGEQRHVTVDAALRMLGFGSRHVVVDVDDHGRISPAGLRTALAAGAGPAIVVSQAGEVNTGAVNPLREVCEIAHAHQAWVHVDGAFGLWAAASTKYRHLVDGVELAQSWSTDAHKWLNTPYDCGLAIVADPAAHAAATATRAAYLPDEKARERDPFTWTPEFSRRARGFAVYAALRSLGRDGVAELVDRCCSHARRFADRLAAVRGAQVLNDVVLNQVLVRFGDDDAVTNAVMASVLASGEAFMSGTTWRGRTAMRISVSNWSTTREDVDRTVAVIEKALSEL
jgi:glutamate/tyrosine decarboxylase-like PLP-dependent enzyme